MSDGSNDKPSPEDQSTQSLESSSETPERIGPYRLLEKIGEGGMGEVWAAEQQEPVRRRVALKIIKRGMDTKQVIARFEAERQALAMMNHPNIAKVFDAGETAAGRPFFVMEYVKGVPIAEHCDRQRLTTRERLELFTQVCEGVQHAHQKAIIHRDLKPSNVLVMVQDGKSVPKIIDFGVAKAIEHRLTERTLYTELGQIVGTPEYMSPEQAEMTQQDIDTRTDVYSLGVMLYELLVGALPFDPKELRRAGFDEIRRRIREEEPSRPSTRVTTLDESSTGSAKKRRTDPAGLAKQLRGDLDWITMKALEKDRIRRYQTASQLAMDIGHYLADEPVVAGPPGVAYRASKFVKRHRVAVVAGSFMAAAVVLGLIVSMIGFAQASRERERAVAERDRAREAEQEARRQAYSANIAAARAAFSTDELAAVRRRLDAAPPEFRNWEWRYLDAASDDSLVVLRGHEGGVASVVFSPDGTRLASASSDKTVRLWDTATGEELAILRGHEDRITCVAFSPDGNRVASGSGAQGKTADNTIRLWDVATSKELAVLEGHRAPVRSVAFSPDGKQLASASGWGDLDLDNSIRLWNVTTGGVLGILQGHQSGVWSVRFSPDGRYLASASADGTVRLWDRSTGKELTVLRGHVSSVTAVAFSSDGKRLASASDDKTVRVWGTETGEELAVLKGHKGSILSVAFSPDGTRLASASSDRTVRVWDAFTGDEQVVLKGHESGVDSVAFSPDGTRLASGSWDGSVRLWDASRSPGPMLLKGHESWIAALAFSPDGTRLAVAPGGDGDGGATGAVHIWDTATGEELAVLHGHIAGVTSVEFSPDGTRLASASWDGSARLWEASTGAELAVMRADKAWIWRVTFSPDGTRLASASGEYYKGGAVRVWDGTTGEELVVLRGHEDYVRSVTFSPDGARLITASRDGTVRIWDALSGEELGVVEDILSGYESTVFAVAFSPDAAYVATRVLEENRVFVYSIATGEEIAVLRGHENWIQSLTFSPDGTRLASGSTFGTTRVWDSVTGEELAVLRGREEIVQSLAFSPDGTRLATGLDYTGTVQLWATVPYRVRHRERQAILAARPEAERVVDDLREEANDWAQVVQRLRSDATLSEPLHRAALNEVLRRAALAEQQAVLAVKPEVQELIDDLWQQLGDWTSVAEHVREDTGLSDRIRRVALNEALRCARVAERLEEKKQVAQRPDADASTLNECAWLLLTCEPARLRDPATAVLLAIRANEMTHQQNPAYLDTLALAVHMTGDTAKAVQTQKKALSLLPEDSPIRDDLEQHLAEFEAALENQED